MFQESQVWSRRLSTKMFFYLSLFRARTVQWSKGMQTNQQVHKLHDMIFCFELSSGFHRQHHPHGSMLSLDFSFSLPASSPWIYVFFDLRHIRYIGGMPAAMHAGASACRLQPVMTCPTRPLSGIIPRAHRVTWCVSELGIASTKLLETNLDWCGKRKFDKSSLMTHLLQTVISIGAML